MTAQTYSVLFPLATSPSVTVPQGGTVMMDDADPETLALLAEGQIVLASAPGAAAMVAADEADTTAQDQGPGQANVPTGQHD